MASPQSRTPLALTLIFHVMLLTAQIDVIKRILVSSPRAFSVWNGRAKNIPRVSVCIALINTFNPIINKQTYFRSLLNFNEMISLRTALSERNEILKKIKSLEAGASVIRLSSIGNKESDF